MKLKILGTYDPNSKPIKIELVDPVVPVITSSKQRPKTLEFHGSDGRTYKFLLKGLVWKCCEHSQFVRPYSGTFFFKLLIGKEDLRLDERVMQLFDLLNSLINLNTTLRKKNLEVIRYNIIPMTNEHGHNGGLIRWIEDSEPVNQIINNVSFGQSHDLTFSLGTVAVTSW